MDMGKDFNQLLPFILKKIRIIRILWFKKKKEKDKGLTLSLLTTEILNVFGQ